MQAVKYCHPLSLRVTTSHMQLYTYSDIIQLDMVLENRLMISDTSKTYRHDLQPE